MSDGTAIILAMFGTSEEEGLTGLLNIRDRTAERFPRVPVRMAFTSPMIRKIWRQRGDDSCYRSAHPEVPGEIFDIGGPVSVITGILRAGCSSLILQPVLGSRC